MAPAGPLLPVRLPGLAHPVFVRPATSDIRTLVQVFVHREYEFALPFLPRTILDAGANVGLASVFFAHQYPHAKIVAIEPEASNFEVLRRNVAPYPNIELRNTAVWHQPQELALLDEHRGHWAFRTEPLEGQSATSPPARTRGETIETILDELQWPTVDLLKVDIEGAEEFVFHGRPPWIHRVGAIAAELHDRFGGRCQAVFDQATSQFEQRTCQGEKVVVVRPSWPPAPACAVVP